MSRGKQGVLTFIAALATVVAVTAAPVSAVMTSGPKVAATDDLAPEPVTGLEAFPGPDGVELSWELSASDLVRQAPVGTDFTSGGTFVNVNDVAGYAVLRNGEEIDTVPAGESEYVDALAAGAGIIYTVVAFDAAGNEAASEPVVVSLGPPPTAIVDDAPIDFGEFATDESDTVVLTIENGAEDVDALLTATFGVEGGSGFSVSPASVQAEAGGSADVEVTFDAAEVGNFDGDYEDVLTVRTNDPNLPEVLIDLSASITEGLSAQNIVVSRAAVRFGQVQVTEGVRAIDVVIENDGGLPLTVSTEFDEAAAAISAEQLTDEVLEAGDDVVVSVSLDPSVGVAAYSTNLVISSDDPDEPEVIVPVTATVVEEIQAPGGVVSETVVVNLEMVGQVVLPGLEPIDADDPAEVLIFLDDPVRVEEATLAMTDLVAQAAGVDPSRIINGHWVQGSLIFVFDIAEPDSAAAGPPPEDVAQTLVTTLADTTTTNPITEVAQVKEVASETVVETLFPRDESGAIVLGWFTRVEDQVSLADFFAFADNFGKTDADADFDADFDIAPDTPDGVVELADFFVFADNFGKVVANAAEIRAALP